MYSIDRLLVVMELDEHDDVVCECVNRLSKVVSFNSLVFLHVADNLDIPKQLVEKYPGLIPPIDESIKGAIEAKIEQYENIKAIKILKLKYLTV